MLFALWAVAPARVPTATLPATPVLVPTVCEYFITQIMPLVFKGFPPQSAQYHLAVLGLSMLQMGEKNFFVKTLQVTASPSANDRRSTANQE